MRKAIEMKMPSVKKGLRIKPKRPFGLHAAFGTVNPKQAFDVPGAAQAFGPAQADGGLGAEPASPPLPTVPQEG